MKVHKGDRVVVLSGKDKGKEGTVMVAMPREGKVIVEGVNVAKRHQKPTRAMQQGGILDKPMPIDVSNVVLLDPTDNKPTKVGVRVADDGERVRYSKRTDKVID